MKWIGRAQSIALITVIAAACDRPAFGQDKPAFHAPSEAFAPAVEPTAYQDLVERLQSAERRLAELEQSSTSDVPVPAPPGVAFLVQNEDETPRRPLQSNDSAADDAGSVSEELAKRFGEMETGWEEFQQAQSEAKAAAKDKPTFKIGGRIHLDHWSFPHATEGIGYFENPDPSDADYGTDPEDRFLFRRIRLEAQGEVPDLMFWRLQVDFNQPQTPQMKDVYLGFRLPYDDSLIIGYQKLPMGLDALYSSRFTAFMERPLVEDAFITDYRRSAR